MDETGVVREALTTTFERMLADCQEVTALGLLVDSQEQWYALTVQTAAGEVSAMMQTGEHIVEDETGRDVARLDPTQHKIIERSPLGEAPVEILVNAFQEIVADGTIERLAPGALGVVMVDGQLTRDSTTA